MSERVIPAGVHLAARRGFLRTAAQSLAASLATIGVVSIVLTGQWWLSAAVAAAGAVATALIAGAASYLSILATGIPGDYQDTADRGE